jgi:hypothetical protein
MGNKNLLRALKKIKASADSEGIKFWLIGGLACAFHVGKLYRDFGDIDLITKDKKDCDIFCDLLEKIGYKKIKEKNIAEGLVVGVYQNKEGVNLDVAYYTGDFGLKRIDLKEDEKELEGVKLKAVSKRFCESYKKYWLAKRSEEKDTLDLAMLD